MSFQDNFPNPVTASFWGLPVSVVTLKNCSQLIYSWAVEKRRKRIYCCTVNDMVFALKHSTAAARLKQADVITPDGMPLVWGLKRRGFDVTRVYAPDLMLSVLKLTAGSAVGHFFYGSGQKTLNNLKTEISRKFPACRLSGFISPPFRRLTQDEENDYIQTIRQISPQILWISLGSQKQIKLASRWSPRIHPCVIITVGAAFDFIAKTKPQAPKLVRDLGTEWLFRLTTEPKRLWRRYFNNIFNFCYFLFKYGLP